MKDDAMKNLFHLPPAQGLYDPEFEKDACGVGFIAHIKGVPSHQNVIDADTLSIAVAFESGETFGDDHDRGYVVLPDPEGPTMMILWLPEAAISSARLLCC